MQDLKKKLPNGVILDGLMRDSEDGTRKILWYGASFDTHGGTFHGVYGVDVFPVGEPLIAGTLEVLTHGYTIEEPAVQDAKSAGLQKLNRLV